MVMIRLKERLAKRVGTGLALWMLVLGAIIPVLDRDLLASDIAIEAEHQEACSLPSHDHTICTQYGKQLWTTGSSGVLEVLPPIVPEVTGPTHQAPPRLRFARPTNPRAPPTH